MPSRSASPGWRISRRAPSLSAKLPSGILYTVTWTRSGKLVRPCTYRDVPVQGCKSKYRNSPTGTSQYKTVQDFPPFGTSQYKTVQLSTWILRFGRGRYKSVQDFPDLYKTVQACTSQYMIFPVSVQDGTSQYRIFRISTRQYKTVQDSTWFTLVLYVQDCTVQDGTSQYSNQYMVHTSTY